MMTVGYFVVHHHCHTVQSSWLGTQTEGGFVVYVALLTSAVFTTDRRRGHGATQVSLASLWAPIQDDALECRVKDLSLFETEKEEKNDGYSWFTGGGFTPLSLKWSIAVWVPWWVTHWKTLILA